VGLNHPPPSAIDGTGRRRARLCQSRADLRGRRRAQL